MSSPGCRRCWHTPLLGTVLDYRFGTTPRLVGSAVLGGVFGLGIVYGAFYSAFVKHHWAQLRTRFIGLFLLIMGGQLLLALRPTWTFLTMATTFLTVILARTYIYIRTR